MCRGWGDSSWVRTQHSEPLRSYQKKWTPIPSNPGLPLKIGDFFSLQCTHHPIFWLPTDSMENSRYSCNHLQMTVFAQAGQPPSVISSISQSSESRKVKIWNTPNCAASHTSPFKALLGWTQYPLSSKMLSIKFSKPIPPEAVVGNQRKHQSLRHPHPTLRSTTLTPEESPAFTRQCVRAVCSTSTLELPVYSSSALGVAAISVSSFLCALRFCSLVTSIQKRLLLAFRQMLSSSCHLWKLLSFGNIRLDLTNLH